MKLSLLSPAQTASFGRTIGHVLRGGDVLALRGDLGAGKTSLVRGVAAALGVPSKSVSSPTFVLVHEYQGRLPLFHVDLYRIKEMADVEEMGLSSYFTESGVTAIEWADRFPSLLPRDRLDIHLRYRRPRGRMVSLSASGPLSFNLLLRIRKAWAAKRRRSRHSRSSLAGGGNAGRRKAPAP
ncbi:MAG: tRNA (adenosine(37)-N6)-threonylcarbamoyltransferase complex ATPase subunit type 1 TsaE [Nitrospira sp.]|nr:tRNA (adenosine(37)-N6)-threonylcarbamoyltransferase complex ATPase subunit type 1 TsaE [Nitrospira sp.]